MSAQYGKMDVILPWAETMVRYAGCHPARGSIRLKTVLYIFKISGLRKVKFVVYCTI
jgi:hypothetical protein